MILRISKSKIVCSHPTIKIEELKWLLDRFYLPTKLVTNNIYSTYIQDDSKLEIKTLKGNGAHDKDSELNRNPCYCVVPIIN